MLASASQASRVNDVVAGCDRSPVAVGGGVLVGVGAGVGVGVGVGVAEGGSVGVGPAEVEGSGLGVAAGAAQVMIEGPLVNVFSPLV